MGLIKMSYKNEKLSYKSEKVSYKSENVGQNGRIGDKNVLQK